MTQKDLMLLYARLQEMLDGIETDNGSASDALREKSANLPDDVDRAAMESERTLTLLMRERNHRTSKEIKKALARFETGEYGICEECGEDIGVPRLLAQPFATLCVHCKAQLENEQRPFGKTANY